MSNFKIILSKQADKYLAKNNRLRSAFEEWRPSLEANPYIAHDGLLKNEFYKGLQVYKKRLLVKFRALFIIDDERLVVELFKVAPRGEAYKD